MPQPMQIPCPHCGEMMQISAGAPEMAMSPAMDEPVPPMPEPATALDAMKRGAEKVKRKPKK